MTTKEKATKIIKLIPYWDLDDDVGVVLQQLISDIEGGNVNEILKYFKETPDYHKVIHILNK